MNDRFKFRVWDKVFNRYWTDEEIKENAAWLLFPDNDNIDNVEIEQPIGLKDKSGKPIYEGDVVEFYSMNLLDAMGGRHMERRVGKVVWNNECLKEDIMVGDETIPDLCVKTDDGHFVVIGNIHEENQDSLIEREE